MKIQEEHHDWILRQTMDFLNSSSQNDSIFSKAFSATHLRESNEWVAALPSLAYWDLHFDSINCMREVNDLSRKTGQQTYPESFQPFQDLRPKRGIIGGGDELDHG
jgi:hypothetical protein